MKNKKKIIIIISAIILFLAIGIIASQIRKNNKTYNTIDDFDDIKELVEYYKCDYKKMKNSKEEGFSKDIYLTLMKDPIDNEGNTEKLLYETLFKLISQKLEYENYRIIDESRDLTVRVMFDESKNGYYTINDVNNYFDNLQSLYSINNQKEGKISQINVTSSELQNIINNNWIRKKANLGNKTSTCENYDIYWNNGYKVRTINSKIYNIIFTKNYQKEVFEGIKVGMTNEEIKNVLGNPTYEMETEIDIIGYKFEQLYVFFSDGEISIYRPDEYDEESNNKFAEIYTKLINNGDYKTFITELTKIYPDYSNYIQEENYVIIRYPLRGFEIKFGENQNNGMTIYDNYQGKITENIKITDIKDNKIIPNNTYYNLQMNLVLIEEMDRLIIAPYDEEQLEEGEFAKTNKYITYYEKNYNVFRFYSRDKQNPDFEKIVPNATCIYSITENLFAYGVRNDGIYIIDANTMQSNKIIDSNKENIIKKIENNTIYYDDESIQISYN